MKLKLLSAGKFVLQACDLRKLGSFYIQSLKYLDQICSETDTGNSHNKDPLYSQTLPEYSTCQEIYVFEFPYAISSHTLVHVTMMNCLLLQQLSVRCNYNKLQEILHPLKCIKWQSFTQHDLCCHNSSLNYIEIKHKTDALGSYSTAFKA